MPEVKDSSILKTEGKRYSYAEALAAVSGSIANDLKCGLIPPFSLDKHYSSSEPGEQLFASAMKACSGDGASSSSSKSSSSSCTSVSMVSCFDHEQFGSYVNGLYLSSSKLITSSDLSIEALASYVATFEQILPKPLLFPFVRSSAYKASAGGFIGAMGLPPYYAYLYLTAFVLGWHKLFIKGDDYDHKSANSLASRLKDPSSANNPKHLFELCPDLRQSAYKYLLINDLELKVARFGSVKSIVLAKGCEEGRALLTTFLTHCSKTDYWVLAFEQLFNALAPFYERTFGYCFLRGLFYFLLERDVEAAHYFKYANHYFEQVSPLVDFICLQGSSSAKWRSFDDKTSKDLGWALSSSSSSPSSSSGNKRSFTHKQPLNAPTFEDFKRSAAYVGCPDLSFEVLSFLAPKNTADLLFCPAFLGMAVHFARKAYFTSLSYLRFSLESLSEPYTEAGLCAEGNNDAGASLGGFAGVGNKAKALFKDDAQKAAHKAEYIAKIKAQMAMPSRSWQRYAAQGGAPLNMGMMGGKELKKAGAVVKGGASALKAGTTSSKSANAALNMRGSAGASGSLAASAGAMSAARASTSATSYGALAVSGVSPSSLRDTSSSASGASPSASSSLTVSKYDGLYPSGLLGAVMVPFSYGLCVGDQACESYFAWLSPLFNKIGAFYEKVRPADQAKKDDILAAHFSAAELVRQWLLDKDALMDVPVPALEFVTEKNSAFKSLPRVSKTMALKDVLISLASDEEAVLLDDKEAGLQRLWRLAAFKSGLKDGKGLSLSKDGLDGSEQQLNKASFSAELMALQNAEQDSLGLMREYGKAVLFDKRGPRCNLPLFNMVASRSGCALSFLAISVADLKGLGRDKEQRLINKLVQAIEYGYQSIGSIGNKGANAKGKGLGFSPAASRSGSVLGNKAGSGVSSSSLGAASFLGLSVSHEFLMMDLVVFDYERLLDDLSSFFKDEKILGNDLSGIFLHTLYPGTTAYELVAARDKPLKKRLSLKKDVSKELDDEDLAVAIVEEAEACTDEELAKDRLLDKAQEHNSESQQELVQEQAKSLSKAHNHHSESHQERGHELNPIDKEQDKSLSKEEEQACESAKAESKSAKQAQDGINQSKVNEGSTKSSNKPSTKPRMSLKQGSAALSASATAASSTPVKRVISAQALAQAREKAAAHGAQAQTLAKTKNQSHGADQGLGKDGSTKGKKLSLKGKFSNKSKLDKGG